MGTPYGFSRSRKGVIRIRLDAIERGLLLSLAEQMAQFVAPDPPDPDADPLAAFVGIDDSAAQSDDPALARLLPDAFRDDAEASAEFRRFTERGLRESKMAHALTVGRAVTATTDELTVPEEEVGAWLGFLNDTRIALGSRLEITEDNHDELAGLADDDPRAGLFQVYDWLTYLQDALVQLLMP
jgi:hypothetical protein